MWPEQAFYIIPRKEWNPKPPKSVFGLAKPAKHVMVTWTNSDHCHDRTTCLKTMQDLQDKHIESGMDDIAFNFVVGGDLIVYEGRGWKIAPIKIERRESIQSTSILIGVVGQEGMVLAEEKHAVVDKLISYGKNNGLLMEYISEIPLFDITQLPPMLSTK